MDDDELGSSVKMNLVSIIMPSCNSEKYIATAIESVTGQSYQNWELIVVDDYSTDDTPNIVTAFEKVDSRIVLIRQYERLGPAKSRNRGIKLARGRFIAFLDSDDVWLSEKLERQLSLMQSNNAALTYTAYQKMNSNGAMWPSAIEVPHTLTYRDLLKTNHIGCLTAMYDTQQLGKLYMPEDTKREDLRLWLQIAKLMHHHEDYAFWLGILKSIGSSRSRQLGNTRVMGINEVLALHRVHSQSVSSNKLRAATYQWAVYRKVEKLPLAQSLYYFLHYAYHGWKKNRRHR